MKLGRKTTYLRIECENLEPSRRALVLKSLTRPRPLCLKLVDLLLPRASPRNTTPSASIITKYNSNLNL